MHCPWHSNQGEQLYCVYKVFLLQPSGEMFSVDASYLPCPKTTASHTLVTNTSCETVCAKESKAESERDSACRQGNSQVELRGKVISCLHILENLSVDNHLANGAINCPGSTG